VLISDEVKSIGGLYDLVIRAQPDHFINGNYQGSILTMTSQQGIFFGIILLVSNFGAVIVSISTPLIEYLLIFCTDGHWIFHKSIRCITRQCFTRLRYWRGILLQHSMGYWDCYGNVRSRTGEFKSFPNISTSKSK
jgi:hypothetical protein